MAGARMIRNDPVEIGSFGGELPAGPAHTHIGNRAVLAALERKHP